MQDFTFHMHTNEFDGDNSVFEMVQKARELGFKHIGISNHFIVHPKIKEIGTFYQYSVQRGYSANYNSSFEECLERFRRNYAEIDRVSKELDFPIYKGMEVDFFEYDGWREGFDLACNELNPDYLIGTAHLVEYNGLLLNNYSMAQAPEEEKDEILHIYWHNIRAAIKSGLFDWIAHLDLPKKAGLLKEEKWIPEEEKTLKCLAEHNMKIEINTGLYKPECYEPYPSPRILRRASEYGIKMFLSDDSHHINHIGRHFDEAFELAKECGAEKNMVTNFRELLKENR